MKRSLIGTAAALLGVVALVGCGGSHGQAMPGTITDTSLQAVSGSHGFHSATHRYSVRQVKQAFAAYGVQLRSVSPKAYKGLLAFLDGGPTHPIYVYVSLKACKCALKPAIRTANVTHHGNVAVLWRSPESTPVHAALRALD